MPNHAQRTTLRPRQVKAACICIWMPRRRKCGAMRVGAGATDGSPSHLLHHPETHGAMELGNALVAGAGWCVDDGRALPPSQPLLHNGPAASQQRVG